MEKKLLKSGEFLVNEIDYNTMFIPEEFNEEQKMIAQTCRDFLESEVFPNLDKLDKQDRELMRSILKKAGELGLMGVAIPEEYNGFGQSYVTQMHVAEVIGAGHSFSVAFMAHTGIGTMPIMYYGNEEQRQKYVTGLALGELIGAYCLTEPGAGSDANSGKTNARLSEDSTHYILNGQKMWITNAGFCDTQIVFAKIENDRVLSAFLVESSWDGVVIGPDEHKLGIKGSSTAQVYYNDVKVPAENLIGKRGEGFRIALNILHMGRLKLGANVLGAAKQTITESVKYANERKQFGTFISSFGAIKYKLAEQVIQAFTLETATYRVSKDIDDLIQIYLEQGMEKGRASIEAIGHYAVEAAILKVYGSEVLDYVVDEGVQIHGGMGYSAEVNVERAYRDSRINRIFEGTNEINRLLVIDTAMKRGMKGDFDLAGEALRAFESVKEITSAYKVDDTYESKMQFIRNLKKTALIVLHQVSQTFGKSLITEQEVLNNLSDMMTGVYVSESLLMRVQKCESQKLKNNIALYKDILEVNLFETAALIRNAAQQAICSLGIEETITEQLYKAVGLLAQYRLVNVKDARRRIADYLIEQNEYKI